MDPKIQYILIERLKSAAYFDDSKIPEEEPDTMEEIRKDPRKLLKFCLEEYGGAE